MYNYTYILYIYKSKQNDIYICRNIIIYELYVICMIYALYTIYMIYELYTIYMIYHIYMICIYIYT